MKKKQRKKSSENNNGKTFKQFQQFRLRFWKKGEKMIGKENLTSFNTFNAYSCKVSMHRICSVIQSAKRNMVMDDI